MGLNDYLSLAKDFMSLEAEFRNEETTLKVFLYIFLLFCCNHLLMPLIMEGVNRGKTF